MPDEIWKPHVTVAAVAERDGLFLMVEERIEGRLILNQPAGHLDEGESLLAAVCRETLEESAWVFEPADIIGLYLWRQQHGYPSFLRVAFAGRCVRHYPEKPLDTGVQRALWMTRDEIAAQSERLRSPLVLRCVDDYLAGHRYPLELLQHIGISNPGRGA